MKNTNLKLKYGIALILFVNICFAYFVSADLLTSSGTNTYSTSGVSSTYSGSGYTNYNSNYYGTSYADYSNANNYNYGSSGLSSNTYSTSSLGTSSYTGSSINTQYYNPNTVSNTDYSSYTSSSIFWPKFNTQDCTSRQDVLMQIMPGGCSPSVVRSDLLEEQNVPVFCKVMSVQVNPLIDLTNIRSLHFSGDYPKGISGVSYYPARAAISKTSKTSTASDLTKSPINTNMGYLVIVLSKNEIEGDMPESISGNITATINYDSSGAYGVGTTNFYSSILTDLEWRTNYKQYGFWNGKAYVRVESIDPQSATIGIYKDVDTKEATVTLRAGETSKDIYLSGYYCAAGMNLRLDSIDAPVTSALLQLNDQQVWVTKGDRILDSKCRVTDITSSGTGGKVSISCSSVKNGNIVLSLNAGRATFTSVSGQKDLILGDKVDENKNVYVAYLGMDVNNKNFAVLVRDDFSTTKSDFANKGLFDVISKVVSSNRKSVYDLTPLIKSEILKQYKSKMGKVDSSTINKNVEVSVVQEGKESFGVSLDEVLVATDKNWNREELSTQEQIALEYYETAIKNYEELALLYPNEKTISTEDSYAAIGLYEAAKLAREFGMNAKAQKLYDQIISDYPNSNLANTIKSERDFLTKYDTTKSKSSINLNGISYTMDLLDIKIPSKSDSSAVLSIDGKEETLALGDIKTLNRGEIVQTIQLTKLSSTTATLKYDKSSKNKTSSVSKVETLDTSKIAQTSLDGVEVRLVRINLNEQAKISVIPKTFGTSGQSNFQFSVGIEKRAINLSTDQTKEMMDSLLKNIAQLNDIISNLGKVIKIMKASCFGTAAILNAKTLLDGASGESMARTTIMTATGGWNEKCEKLVSEKQYDTLNQCLLAKNDEIQKDVSIYSNQIQQTNSLISSIESKLTTTKTDILDFQGQVDSKKSEEEFSKAFDSFCSSQKGDVVLTDKDKTKVSFGGTNGICSMNNTLTYSQKKDIMTLTNAKNAGGSDVLSDVLSKKLGGVVLSGRNTNIENSARQQAEADAKKYNLGLNTLTAAGDSIVYGDVKRITTGDLSNSAYKNFKSGSSVVRVFIPARKSFGQIDFVANSEVAGKEVIVEVKGNTALAGGEYSPDGAIVQIDGTAVSSNASKSVRDYMSLAGLNKIKLADNKAYTNQMVDIDKLSVKYFDSSPYKGLPSEVPFDVANGWYVELEYVLSGAGKPYDDSGKAVNYYICNVGSNGLIEFKKSADDICRYYNGNVNSDLSFPGMSATESKQLISKAQQAITDAAKQYGNKKITINGRTFNSGVSFGGSDGRCTDFMSPSDCSLLFNVCDPVICPASRCDMGGRYRVDNVISSGIVGSLLLCLPNAKEGVAIPICLTGVHAGLESYVSILNSTYQCLNESLTTGKTIGICDEIKSIYICEFFWKQASPLLNVLLPKLLESSTGQGVRGGGEYLTVQTAWDNTMNSVNYFKDQYAVNSMSAFSSRSSTDVGTEVCKSYVSVLGSNANGTSWFDRLIEPDSPIQFSAWFSESVLSTATVPSTSQYKVYYHIYSGKDQGTTYAVYLKDIASTSGIYSTGSYTVASGYIPIGSQVDQAKDFTAPSGYKQLCVSVNGNDQCGFGKVSTSYMINSLTDEYLSEQANQTSITTQTECISGTPSLLSTLSPNLQSDVESTIDSSLYSQGITRVCASQNPGKQVTTSGQYDTTNSSYDRWKSVGYCDDPTIICWIDTNSVSTSIKDTALKGNVTQTLNLNQIGETGIWTEETTISVLTTAENAINSLSISSTDSKELIENKIGTVMYNLNRLAVLGTTNVYKSRGLLLVGRLYRKVSESLITDKIRLGSNYLDNATTVSSTTSSSSGTSIDYANVDNTISTTTTGTPASDNTSITTTASDIVLWKDSMLKDNIVIKVSYLTSTKLYKHTASGWVTDDSSFSTSQSYVEGVRFIVKSMNILGQIVIDKSTISFNSFSSDDAVATQVFEILQA